MFIIKYNQEKMEFRISKSRLPILRKSVPHYLEIFVDTWTNLPTGSMLNWEDHQFKLIEESISALERNS